MFPSNVTVRFWTSTLDDSMIDDGKDVIGPGATAAHGDDDDDDRDDVDGDDDDESAAAI
jgi:hypothetical protein